MAVQPVPLVLLALALVAAPAPALGMAANATPEIVSNSIASENKSAPVGEAQEGLGLAQDAVQRSCAASYTMTCLKLDALSVLSRMAVPASYDLLPGVTIHRQEAKQAAGAGAQDLPADLVRSLAADSAPRVNRRLDDYLMSRFGSFLDAHTVQVHLLDLQPVASLRRALQGGENDSTGRRKQNGLWQQLMGAGMMMGGSTLTMGLSALAAMAGKALMLSMLSLVLSALSGMNGGGGGGGGGHSQKQTTYEIISKPIYTHGHSHSAELHHEPSGPAGYGLYGRAKDAAEGALAAGTGASGVGGSALGLSGGLGGAPPGSAYITQFPRSLQESTAQVSHQGKKAEDDKGQSPSSPAAANYDSLLIRNLQYVKGQDGRAKYAIANAADLVPSETDYNGADDGGAGGGSAGSAPRKYAGHDDPAARSFQLSADEEEAEGLAGVSGLAGVYEAHTGVLAGPRSLHAFARLPPAQPAALVQHHYQSAASRTPAPPMTSASFREPLPAGLVPLSAPGSSWEAVTAAPPLATSTGRPQPQVNPAYVVAKPVASSRDEEAAGGGGVVSAAPRTVAYRAYS